MISLILPVIDRFPSLVELALVARVKPAFGVERLGGLVRLAEVALSSRSARARGSPRSPAIRTSTPSSGRADGAEPVPSRRLPQRDDRRGLGHAVPLDTLNPTHKEHLRDRLSSEAPPRHDDAQAPPAASRNCYATSAVVQRHAGEPRRDALAAVPPVGAISLRWANGVPDDAASDPRVRPRCASGGLVRPLEHARDGDQNGRARRPLRLSPRWSVPPRR